MVIDNLALLMVASLMVALGVMKLALIRRESNTTPAPDPDAYGMCAPARYDSYTARPAAAPRRILEELAAPAGWREGELVAIAPGPAAWLDDYEPEDEPEDEPLAVVVPDLEPVAVEPQSAPIAVPNWPTRQPVQPVTIEEEPAPIVINWTAARFGALEIKRD